MGNKSNNGQSRSTINKDEISIYKLIINQRIIKTKLRLSLYYW